MTKQTKSKQNTDSETSGSESEIQEVEYIEVESFNWTADNVIELQEAKISRFLGRVAFKQTSTFKDEKTKEEKKVTNLYVNLEIDGVVKPSKVNNTSTKKILEAYPKKKWSDLVGKYLVATLDEFNGNPYITWIPKPKLD